MGRRDEIREKWMPLSARVIDTAVRKVKENCSFSPLSITV